VTCAREIWKGKLSPGPNVATGHASVIFSQETQVRFARGSGNGQRTHGCILQINLAIQLIRPVLDGKARSFAITSEATDEYNGWLQGRLAASVWTECMSYYRAGRRDGKIVATFPGPVALFWWLARRPVWGRYRAEGAGAWERERRERRAWGLVFAVVVVLGAGAGLGSGVRLISRK
jgi:hypothetical protein